MNSLKQALLVFAVAGLLLLSACSSLPRERAVTAGPVNHVVLCWLREPGNTDHQRRIIEASKRFRGMPGVLELRVGRVLQSERGIVDDSFDVGIILSFASREDMERYLEHPVHVAAVRDVIRPLTRRIVVYDFIGE